MKQHKIKIPDSKVEKRQGPWLRAAFQFRAIKQEFALFPPPLSLFLSFSLSIPPFWWNALHFDIKANIIKVLPFHLCLATINDTRRYLPRDMKYTRDEVSHPVILSIPSHLTYIYVCIRNIHFYQLRLKYLYFCVPTCGIITPVS